MCKNIKLVVYKEDAKGELTGKEITVSGLPKIEDWDIKKEQFSVVDIDGNQEEFHQYEKEA